MAGEDLLSAWKNISSSSSSSGHDLRPINDLFRPHDFIQIVSLMVVQVFFFVFFL
jgi:hypothetical protein